MVAKPFMPMARAAAKAHGRPLLHMVELPYAIINISAEGARELADKTFEQIVSALTGHK